MANPLDLLLAMDTDRFAVVLAASPKKFREQLYRLAGIRIKGDAFSVSSVGKNRQRAEKLHERFRNGLELKDEVVEEIIRNYLFTQRPLLADALDLLGVKHDQGLTDEDLDFIAELPEDSGREIRSKLAAAHSEVDVDLYVRFMGIPGAI